MTQIESVVEPDGVADDVGRESVALVSIHPPILPVTVWRQLSWPVWRQLGWPVRFLTPA